MTDHFEENNHINNELDENLDFKTNVTRLQGTLLVVEMVVKEEGQQHSSPMRKMKMMAVTAMGHESSSPMRKANMNSVWSDVRVKPSMARMCGRRVILVKSWIRIWPKKWEWDRAC